MLKKKINSAESFGEQFEKAARFWDPNQAAQPFAYDPQTTAEIEEEMKKFTEGFAYRSPKWKYNMVRQALKEMPKNPIRIIADNPEEQHLADQLALIVNHYREEEYGEETNR